MPTTSGQGIDGMRARAASETRAAASPISWIALTMARRMGISVPRSTRLRPAARRSTSRAAFSMCCARTRSSAGCFAGSRGMEGSCLPEHLVTEVPGALHRCAQINGAPDHLRELDLHAGQGHQARRSSRQELDEHVYIACGSEPVSALGRGGPQDAAEERQAGDAVPAAEIRNAVLGEVDAVDEHDVLLKLYRQWPRTTLRERRSTSRRGVHVSATPRGRRLAARHFWELSGGGGGWLTLERAGARTRGMGMLFGARNGCIRKRDSGRRARGARRGRRGARPRRW